MEAFIFLAATVSRHFISHPPDHCWTLVILVSVDLGILYQRVGQWLSYWEKKDLPML